MTLSREECSRTQIYMVQNFEGIAAQLLVVFPLPLYIRVSRWKPITSAATAVFSVPKESCAEPELMDSILFFLFFPVSFQERVKAEPRQSWESSLSPKKQKHKQTTATELFT